MLPLTRVETFLATAAGDPDAPNTLPEPKTSVEVYLKELCGRVDDIAETSAEEISAAVTDYLDEHGIGISAATAEDMEEAMNNA